MKVLKVKFKIQRNKGEDEQLLKMKKEIYTKATVK